MLPFTTETFFQVFQDYNQAIWPAQVIAYALALICLAVLRFPRPETGRLIPAVLSLFWLWMGVAYHWLYFASIISRR